MGGISKKQVDVNGRVTKGEKEEADGRENIGPDLEANIHLFKDRFDQGANFDIVARNAFFFGFKGIAFFVDGFMDSLVVEGIFEKIMVREQLKEIPDLDEFSQRYIPYFSVKQESDVEKLVQGMYSGLLLILIDGLAGGILIDARSYPQRDSSEPEKDKVFRGSRDGFLESVVSNAALIRRRIRAEDLKMEKFNVGKQTKTDIIICHLKGRANPELLVRIKKIVQEEGKNLDALTMNQESMARLLFPPKWHSVFPHVKFSERPDTASAQLLKGSIVILVDNSPSALILPVGFLELMEEANDYYFPPLIGGYQKTTRLIVSVISVFWAPVWLLMNQVAFQTSGAFFRLLAHIGGISQNTAQFLSGAMGAEILPDWCQFVIVKEQAAIPLILQLLLLEILIDGLKLASLNTPSMLTTSLSMIGAIVVSDFAVESGWFSPEALLYEAFIAIATYSEPDFQMGYAFKFVRLSLLGVSWLFGVWGFVLAIIISLAIFIAKKPSRLLKLKPKT